LRSLDLDIVDLDTSLIRTAATLAAPYRVTFSKGAGTPTTASSMSAAESIPRAFRLDWGIFVPPVFGVRRETTRGTPLRLMTEATARAAPTL
jgi:hypothetical protein